MNLTHKSKVAIVNYGVGNLFSVKQACEKCGMDAVITFSKSEIRSADAVILPGVGAFGAAMNALRRLHLIDIIKEAVFSLKPFVGVCLGMQLLMEKSYEFGEHDGLGIVKGTVVRFEDLKSNSHRVLKIPHIGWNTFYKPKADVEKKTWKGSFLESFSENKSMYFVHSYYVKLNDSKTCLSMSQYGDTEFCSSLQYKNIFACQFHPERSGPEGLRIYEALASKLRKS